MEPKNETNKNHSTVGVTGAEHVTVNIVRRLQLM